MKHGPTPVSWIEGVSEFGEMDEWNRMHFSLGGRPTYSLGKPVSHFARLLNTRISLSQQAECTLVIAFELTGLQIKKTRPFPAASFEFMDSPLNTIISDPAISDQTIRSAETVGPSGRPRPG